MTELQIILALEAVLCAAEGKFAGNQQIHDVFAQLEKITDKVIDRIYGDLPFDKILEAQKEAVQALVDNPVLFGHE